MLKILINNEEVVCSNSFTIKETMLQPSSTILKNVFPKNWEEEKKYTNKFYFPRDYSKCVIYDDDQIIFQGVVKNTGNINLKPEQPHFCDLQILDYKTFLSECDLLDFVISGKTIKEAIEYVGTIVERYGLHIVDIVLGEAGDKVIGAYSTLNKSPYDVFQYLAEISNARWFTKLTNDAYLGDYIGIYFYSQESLERYEDLEYTKEYFEENSIIDISYNYNTNDYRNKQVIISDEVYGQIPYTNDIISDGYNKTYNTLNNIAEMLSIYVNGQSKSFATNTEKEFGVYADFYYTKGTNKLESEDSYPSGTLISIRYTPIVKGRQTASNTSEINRIASMTTEGAGTICKYENRNDVLDINELGIIANNYIKYKGTAEILLTVKTFNKDLYEIGHQVYFDMPELLELSKDYLIKSKTIEIIQNGDEKNIFYTYELSSSYNDEQAINYFDNQRRKANGNISEGDFITRNIDISREATIVFDNILLNEVQIQGDNILECTLEAPLNN